MLKVEVKVLQANECMSSSFSMTSYECSRETLKYMQKVNQQWAFNSSIDSNSGHKLF